MPILPSGCKIKQFNLVLSQKHMLLFAITIFESKLFTIFVELIANLLNIDKNIIEYFELVNVDQLSCAQKHLHHGKHLLWLGELYSCSNIKYFCYLCVILVVLAMVCSNEPNSNTTWSGLQALESRQQEWQSKKKLYLAK